EGGHELSRLSRDCRHPDQHDQLRRGATAMHRAHRIVLGAESARGIPRQAAVAETRRAPATTAGRVAAFLRRYRGVGFCAKCLAREVDASPAMVQASWLELLDASEFDRSFRWC